MNTIFMIALFAFIILIDFIPLIKYKQTKTAIIFGFFFVCLLTYVLLPSLGVKSPSIITFISYLFDKIGLHY